MIRDLDATIEELITTRAEPGSELAAADISFEIPDATWRSGLTNLTVNCYLYDVHENLEMRTYEPIVQRDTDNSLLAVRQAPRRINCAYCITAWSTATTDAVLEEHRVLSQILRVLLTFPTLPADTLQGSLTDQIPPYPTVVASSDGMKNNPDFWGALDQQLKPSLNYIITLAMMLDEEPTEAPASVDEIVIEEHHM